MAGAPAARQVLPAAWQEHLQHGRCSLQHGRCSCSTAGAPSARQAHLQHGRHTCSTAGAPGRCSWLLAGAPGRRTCSMAGAPAAWQVLLAPDTRICSMAGAPGRRTCSMADAPASWQAHLRRHTSLSEGAPASRKLKKLVFILECAMVLVLGMHHRCSCAVPGLATCKSSRT